MVGDDICMVLGAFVFVAVIVTVLGHGIWLMLARVFRWLAKTGSTSGDSEPNIVQPAHQRDIIDLLTTRQLIERLHRQGAIDNRLYEQVRDALDTEQQRRTDIPPTAPAQTKPPQRSPGLEPAGSPAIESAPEVVTRLPSPPERTKLQVTAPPPPAQPVEPREPHKPFTEILAAFMEAKNIRWGELIGGMLIVFCSVALVISFWSQIAQTPVLKFFLFTAVTAVLFAVGLYSEYRWKLPTTSRGLLIISTLLVPLNFLAIAAFSEGPGATEAMVIIGEVMAIALFACLAFMAGRVIAPPWSVVTVIGVVGASASQLLFRRFADAGMSTLPLLALAMIPTACYLLATGVMLRRAWFWPTLGKTKVNMIFTLLGITAFATAVSLGLLVFKSGNIRQTLQSLAPLVSLLGAPVLVSGLLMWKQITAARLAALRTAGTSIAIVGALVMLASVALAWSDAANLLPVSLLNFLILTAAALLLRMPWAHLPAGVCLTLAYLAGFHVAADHLTWHSNSSHMALALLSETSGSALVALVAVFAGASVLFARFGRRLDGQMYSWLCGAAAVASLLLVTWHGFGRADDHGATFVYLIFALSASALAWRTRRPSLSWTGGILLLIAIVQGFTYRFAPPWELLARWQVATLIYAMLMTGAAFAARQWARERQEVSVRPTESLALMTSLVAALLLVADVSFDHALALSIRAFCLAGVWLILALLNGRLRPVLFTASQVAITFGVVLAVTARLNHYTWFEGASRVFHPWSLQAYFTALALLSLTWSALRLAIPSDLIRTPRASFDHFVTGAVLIGLTLLVSYGILPNVIVEFAPTIAATEQAYNLFGPWSVYAVGIGSWYAVSALLAVCIVGFRERFNLRRLLAVMLLVAVGCILVAAQWRGLGATASAMRWCFAAYLLVASVPCWWRDRLTRLVTPLGWPGSDELSPAFAQYVRVALMLITIPPVILLTLYPMGVALAGGSMLGPSARSFFGQIGPTVSYVLPLAIVSAALVGHALRERSSGFAFGAGLVVNLAATLGWIMSVVEVGGRIGSVELVQLAQVNAIATSIFVLGWLAVRTWWIGRHDRVALQRQPPLLIVQVIMALAVNAILIVPSTVWLITRPADPVLEAETVGNVAGWVALLLSLAALTCSDIQRRGGFRVGSFTLAAMLTAALTALSVWEHSPQQWVGYHTLLATQAAAAWLILGVGWCNERKPTSPVAISTARWSMLSTVFIVLLALRGCFGDPYAPWWSIGGLVAMAALLGTLARWRMHGGYLYAAGLLFNLAASIWWLIEIWHPTSHRFAHAWIDLVQVNLVAWIATGFVSLSMKLAAARRGLTWRQWPTVHHVAAIAATVTLAMTVIIGLFVDVTGGSLATTPLLPWLALTATALLLAACLWDPAANYAVSALFALGLVAIGTWLDSCDLSRPWLVWNAVVMLSLYTLLVGCLWRWRDRWLPVRQRLQLPQRHILPATWMLPSVLVIGTAVTVLAYYVVLTFDPELINYSATATLLLRLAAAATVLVCTIALALFDRAIDRSYLRQVILLSTVVAVVAICWAPMTPSFTGEQVFDRAVIVLLVSVLVTAVYGLGFAKLFKRDTPWSQDAGRTLPWVVGLAAATLIFIFAAELYFTVIHSSWAIPVPMADAAIALMIVALVLLVIMLLVFAAIDGRDPLQLSESGRMGYVYAAEVLMAATFLHIRLTMPWLFHGFFQQYWPLIVMFIAFCGVGLSEWFRRLGRLVLAKPLEKTGAFLPLLPVLSFWMLPSNVHYSGLLLAVGLLYGVLAIMRRTYGFGVLGALAANGGLWYFLHHTEHFKLWQHPQLWLIPPALAVLVAAQLNRDRLNDAQMIAIRYICLILVYVSSTIDIFITGVANSPWLPLILAALAVAGVIVGMMLRIQSFLFVGAAFLLLALVTMIWHASAMYQMTWLWYVAGICLGSAIIAVFAVFEKRRTKMLELLEELRQWRR